MGDGCSIRVWMDKWIRDGEGVGLTTPCPDGMAGLMVKDLLIHNEARWNGTLVDSTFNTRDVDLIKGIPISYGSQEDCCYWRFTPTGCYTVKSAYRMGIGALNVPESTIWKKLWLLEVPPKFRFFCWQILTQILPLRQELNRRHIVESDTCSRCLSSPESGSYALVSCPCIRELWIELLTSFELSSVEVHPYRRLC